LLGQFVAGRLWFRLVGLLRAVGSGPSTLDDRVKAAAQPAQPVVGRVPAGQHRVQDDQVGPERGELLLQVGAVGQAVHPAAARADSTETRIASASSTTSMRAASTRPLSIIRAGNARDQFVVSGGNPGREVCVQGGERGEK
jgi:hypothetical protein